MWASINKPLTAARLRGLLNGAQTALMRAALRYGLWDSGYRYLIHPLETAAGLTDADLTFGLEVGDLRRYGADATGTNASDAALTNALKVFGAAGFNGGTIRLPAGSYKFAAAWDLNRLSGITIEGEGNSTAGAAPGTICHYSGTGAAHWIQLTSSTGCHIRNMALWPTDAGFTGAIVRCGNDGSHGDSALCGLERVLFVGTAACYHLELDKCIDFTAKECNFTGGATSVNGQAAAGGSYSNVIKFRDCRWGTCAATPVNYGGENWSFEGCTFEALSTGAAGAFAISATAGCQGVSFRDCWFGDATGGGAWISVNGTGFTCSGCFFSSGNYAIILDNVRGFAIQGNSFQTLTAAIQFGTATCSGGDISGNYFDASVTEAYSQLANAGTDINFNPNHPLNAGNSVLEADPGWEVSRNGMLRQWGHVAVAPSAGAFSVTINFPRAFQTIYASPVISVWNNKGTVTAGWLSASSAASFTVKGTCDSTATNVVVDWQAVGLP